MLCYSNIDGLGIEINDFDCLSEIGKSFFIFIFLEASCKCKGIG